MREPSSRDISIASNPSSYHRMRANNAQNFKIIIPEGIGNCAGNGSRKASKAKQTDTVGTTGMNLWTCQQKLEG